MRRTHALDPLVVDLDRGVDVGAGGLRPHHVLGGAAPDVVERDDLVAHPGCGRGRRRRRRGDGGSHRRRRRRGRRHRGRERGRCRRGRDRRDGRRLGLGHGGHRLGAGRGGRGVENVLAGDATSRSAAPDAGGIEPAFGHEPADDGRGQRRLGSRRSRLRPADRPLGGGNRGRGRERDHRCGCRRLRGRSRRDDRLGGRDRCRRLGGRSRRDDRLGGRDRRRRRGSHDLGSRRFRRNGALVAEHRQARAHVDGVAFGHQDLRDHTRDGRGHLGVDLVGRDLEQRLVGIDVLAHALQPARDRAFRDRLPELGHRHVHCVLLGSGPITGINARAINGADGR